MGLAGSQTKQQQAAPYFLCRPLHVPDESLPTTTSNHQLLPAITNYSHQLLPTTATNHQLLPTATNYSHQLLPTTAPGARRVFALRRRRARRRAARQAGRRAAAAAGLRGNRPRQAGPGHRVLRRPKRAGGGGRSGGGGRWREVAGASEVALGWSQHHGGGYLAVLWP